MTHNKTEPGSAIDRPSFSNPVVVGLHIPKCAGTTFAATCRKHIPLHQFYGNSDPVGFHAYRLPEFATLNYHNIRAVFGHFVFEEMLKFFPPTRTVVLFTGLREPVERVQSEFYFVRKFAKEAGRRSPPFEAWVSNPKHHNNICRRLVTNFPSFIHPEAETMADKAISVLQRFDLVYDSGSFNRDIAPIYQLLGIEASRDRQNITPDQEKIPTSAERIRECNAEDISLYEYFQDHPELSPANLSSLQGRAITNHTWRTGLLGHDPDLLSLYRTIYEKKRNIYLYTRSVNNVVADKLNQLHSVAYEVDTYAREGGEVILDRSRRAMLQDIVDILAGLIQSEQEQSGAEAKRIQQQKKIEEELDSARRELNAIYASRGYRLLEKLRAIRRRIFTSGRYHRFRSGRK